MRPLAEAFQKKYFFLGLQTWSGLSGETLAKVLAERRAGVQVADLIDLSSSSTLAAIKANTILPFNSEALKDFPEEYYDPNGVWATSRVAYFGLGYNTKQVSAADVPKTWDDLLDPRWKGKMAWPANADTGARLFITNIRMTMGEEKAEEYLKKLSAQKIVNYSAASAVALVGIIGQGEYAIGVQIFANNPVQAAQKGASVDVQMMDPVVTSVDTTQVVADAPDPYAAMLMMDYYLSVEGQSVMRNAGYFSPNRLVDPDPAFRRIVPRLIHMKENVITPEISASWMEQSNALFDKYFR